jgi:hypothetical protein
MLEEMEEVFKVDNLSYICGCIPTYRYPVYSSSLISGSAATNNYSSMGSTVPYSMFEPHHADSNGEIITTIDDDADTIVYEPRSLHKYSRDMKEGTFSYYQEPTTAEKKKQTNKQHSTAHGSNLIFKSPEKNLKENHPTTSSDTVLSLQNSTTTKYRSNLRSNDQFYTPKDLSATYINFTSPSANDERGTIEDEDNELSSFLPKSKVSFVPEPNSFGSKAVSSNTPSESLSLQTKPMNNSVLHSNGSKQNSSSSFGNTFYESLFSGRKSNENNSSSVSKNQMQQPHQKSSARKKSRLDEESQFQQIDDEESYEPLIQSFVVKLPFHDK